MKQIDFYMLYYTPRGNGQVVFRLVGESSNRSTPPLPPSDFAALAAVLAQKNLGYDTIKGVFASSDTNDVLIPGAHLAENE